MNIVKFDKAVVLVGVGEFLVKYPRFSSIIKGDGKKLFNIIMRPQKFIEGSVLADHGYPSVLAVAEESRGVIKRSALLTADSFVKQFIGAAVCSLMEANGYKKTGKKKSVPHELFSVGEHYINGAKHGQ